MVVKGIQFPIGLVPELISDTLKEDCDLKYYADGNL